MYEHRILILEEKVAHQERLLGDLDDVLRIFTRRVEKLEAELRGLRSQMSTDGADVPNEKPPHY
ncbi:MAG: SlyX family protein [Deltaproteobacteria bacterium]|nr:SlyX family protein [Deltaproteobacteria bacterium]